LSDLVEKGSQGCENLIFVCITKEAALFAAKEHLCYSYIFIFAVF